MYNPLLDQLKQMEVERKRLVEKVKSTTGFAHEEAVRILKAHDVEVGRLLGLPNTVCTPTDCGLPASDSLSNPAAISG